MKLRSVIFSFIAIILSLFVTTVNADSIIPDSYDVNGEDIYEIDSSKYLPKGGFKGWSIHFKKNANGDIIYCVESHDSAVKNGTMKYTFSKELEAKYAYVLANGYPNKSITGDNEKDYFITGLAVFNIVNPDDYVFKYFDFNNGTYRDVESDVVKEVAKLVNGANSYSYTNPSIKLNINNSFTLSSDKKYYVSSNMNVSITEIVGNYTVILDGAPSGTIITDVNGNEKNTFNTNESFIVKVPVSSIKDLSNEFKVSVSATGTINKAYLYEAAKSKYQNTAILYPVKSDVNDFANINLDLNTEVQISKIDATTGNELAGAKLTVKDSNGKVVDSWISTNEVHVIKGLKPSKYTLTEEVAPDGYVLSTETIEFEVKLVGTIEKVIMKNYLQDESISIYISKQDITTGEELAGAHLELKDNTGEVIYAWVSGNEPFIIEGGLKSGKYFLTEVIAPEGYELSTETVEFTVLEDGTVEGKIIMYNKPETIVEVPSTSSFKTITTSIIGIIVIGLGSMIIYRNYKKNEEY